MYQKAFLIISGGCIAVSLYSLTIRKKLDLRKAKALPGRKKSDSYKGTPRCTCCAAVLTVEAALILPLLTCFFVSILFFFRVLQVELEVQKALDNTGRKLAVYLAGDGAGSAVELAAAQALFANELAEREIAKAYIRGGSAGISLLGSELTRDEVKLSAAYHIRLPMHLFWEWDLSMAQKAWCRKWTGWNGTGTDGNGDVWVFITETGQVYHTVSTCTHLVLSVQSVRREELGVLRNEAGGRYAKCLLCDDVENVWGRVYITNQGDRYHNDLNCSGIKRTVMMVRLSEIGARRLCSRCGGTAP